MRKDLFKAVVLVIFVILFAAIGCSLSAQSLGNIPTESTCGCVVADAFKRTKDTIKMGKAYIYADGVVFKFGSTSTILSKITEDVCFDDKEKVWRKVNRKDNYVVYIQKNTSIGYEIPSGGK